jgi:alpha-amylase
MIVRAHSLATDTDYVQGRIATYLKDLLSLGVKGLRMDAAKREFSSSVRVVNN